MDVLSTDLNNAWRRVLAMIELAKNHAKVHALDTGHAMPNPLLDRLLPSLLFINLVSLLDEALEVFLEVKHMTLPKGYKQDLFHRIKYLNQEGHLKDSAGLQGLREKRNDIAHKEVYATWTEVEHAIAKIEDELQELRFVGTRPNYEFFAERSGAQSSDDPNVAFTFYYCFGLKENDKEVVRVGWTSKVLNE